MLRRPSQWIPSSRLRVFGKLYCILSACVPLHSLIYYCYHLCLAFCGSRIRDIIFAVRVVAHNCWSLSSTLTPWDRHWTQPLRISASTAIALGRWDHCSSVRCGNDCCYCWWKSRIGLQSGGTQSSATIIKFDTLELALDSAIANSDIDYYCFG